MPEQFTHRAICHLRERGQVIKDHFVSKVLAGNPLGDPAERDLLVYQPPGYERSGGRSSLPDTFWLEEQKGDN